MFSLIGVESSIVAVAITIEPTKLIVISLKSTVITAKSTTKPTIIDLTN
jgi:hypothetical protein